MTTIALRPATAEDHPLIYSSFLREYGASPSGRGVPAIILNAKMGALLGSPRWRATVAHALNQPDEAMGYVVYSVDHQLGWIYTKPAYRRIGVARALLKHAGISGYVDCAFVLPEIAKRAQPHGWIARFRPYLPDICALDFLASIDLPDESNDAK